MKNVLITGSSSGIGLVCANCLKEKGYRVFQTGRKSLGLSPEEYISLDLSTLDAADFLYKHAVSKMGSVDILINNAGEYIYSPVEKTDKEAIKRLVNINFEIPYFLTKLTVPSMKKNKFGRIVSISSISAVVGEANASLYAATKSALFGMTKSLALELAEFNITANCISPGWVNTPLTEAALDEVEKEETLDVIPQKRFIEPLEVANLVQYLISDEAKGLTGQNINLCAGLSVGC